MAPYLGIVSRLETTLIALVIIRDFGNADKEIISKRLELREEHVNNVKKQFANGSCKAAGALLKDAHPEQGKTPEINGSFIVLDGASKDEIRKTVEADVYWKNKIFDPSKMEIIPCLLAEK